MDIGKILNSISEYASDVFSRTVTFLSNQFTDGKTIQVKLLTLMISLVIVYFGAKVTYKVAKYGLMILGGVLAISLGYSLIQGSLLP